MAGDLPRAESYERRSFQPRSEEWAPYLLLKARLLAELGSKDEAQRALALLPGNWRIAPQYRALVASLFAAPGSRHAALETPATLPPGEWRTRPKRWRLNVSGRHPGARIEIEVASASREGAAVRVVWNGMKARHQRVVGPTRLHLTPDAWLEINHLELVPIGGGRIRVSESRIRPASGTGLQQQPQGRLPGSPSSPAS